VGASALCGASPYEPVWIRRELVRQAVSLARVRPSAAIVSPGDEINFSDVTRINATRFLPTSGSLNGDPWSCVIWPEDPRYATCSETCWRSWIEQCRMCRFVWPADGNSRKPTRRHSYGRLNMPTPIDQTSAVRPVGEIPALYGLAGVGPSLPRERLSGISLAANGSRSHLVFFRPSICILSLVGATLPDQSQHASRRRSVMNMNAINGPARASVFGT